MSFSLPNAGLIIGSGGADDTFWMQMLVLVIVATLVGVVSLAKTAANKSDQPGYLNGRPSRAPGQTNLLRELKDSCARIFLTATRQKGSIDKNPLGLKPGEAAGRPKSKRDLTSGMELLDLDFLLGLIEHPERNNKKDVTIRKLGFNELVRRKQLSAADSKVLKVYAMNEGNHYSKDIQCAAMKELAGRTRPSSVHGLDSPAGEAPLAPNVDTRRTKVNLLTE